MARSHLLMISTAHIGRLPQRIQDRLGQLNQDVEAIIAKAETHFETEVPRRIAFDMTSTSTSGDLINEYERAQSVSFVTRYEHLPDNLKVHLVEQDSVWQIGNFWELRHVLNDFRPIIQNQKDAVYYARVHNVLCRMLLRINPAEGMVVRILADSGNDITTLYSKWLTENKRAVKSVIGSLEFPYLYNGILQHSDASVSRRYLSDYASGELNYLLWKHVRVLGFIKSMLAPYYRMMNVLTFPKLGPL